MAFGRPYQLHDPEAAANAEEPRKAEISRDAKRTRRQYGRDLIPARNRRLRRTAPHRLVTKPAGVVYLGGKRVGTATKIDVA